MTLCLVSVDRFLAITDPLRLDSLNYSYSQLQIQQVYVIYLVMLKKKPFNFDKCCVCFLIPLQRLVCLDKSRNGISIFLIGQGFLQFTLQQIMFDQIYRIITLTKKK